MILLLRKIIYGLKQSGREWYEVLVDWLKDYDQKLSKAAFDPCVFISEDLILGVYVDDILMTGTPSRISAFIVAAGDRFKLKDLGTPKIILGLEIDHIKENRQVLLHQQTYVMALLQRYGMKNCNGRRTPLDANSFPPRIPADVEVDSVQQQLY